MSPISRSFAPGEPSRMLASAAVTSVEGVAGEGSGDGGAGFVIDRPPDRGGQVYPSRGPGRGSGASERPLTPVPWTPSYGGFSIRLHTGAGDSRQAS